jgi:hypothetical protein
MHMRGPMRSCRSIKALAMAVAACGLTRMVHAQAVPVTTSAFNDSEAEPGSLYQTAGNGEYFAVDGTTYDAVDYPPLGFPSWAVVDFKTTSLLGAGTEVSSVLPSLTLSLYNDQYTNSATSTVTLSFFLVTDTTSSIATGGTDLQYESPSDFSRGLNNPGEAGAFAAGSSYYALGTATYNSTTLTNNQLLTYNLTLPSTAAVGSGGSATSYIQSQINQGQNVRLVITSNETDSNYVSYDGAVLTSGTISYAPQLTFNLTSTSAPQNDSKLYVGTPGTTAAAVNIGSYINIGSNASPQYEYAIYKGGVATTTVTLGNGSSTSGSTANYVVVPGTLGADASAGGTNPLNPGATTAVTIGFSASDTSSTQYPGGSQYIGTVQFLDNNNVNAAPVTVTASTNVIQGRFLDAGTAAGNQAFVNQNGLSNPYGNAQAFKALVGSTLTVTVVNSTNGNITPGALQTTNTTTNDHNPDDLTTLTLLAGAAATPYTMKDPVTGASVGAISAVAPNYDQLFDADTGTADANGTVITGAYTASVVPLLSGIYGDDRSVTVGTTSYTYAANYSEFENASTGAETVIQGEGLPGETNDDDNARVYFQWQGYQPASVSAANTTHSGAATASSGDTLTLSNAASTDNIYSTGYNAGMRADAWVTSVTTPDGWSQNGLSAVVTGNNAPGGTPASELYQYTVVNSGTVISGQTSGSSVPFTVSFTPANDMINGTYSNQFIVVGLENEQDTAGATPNDLPAVQIPLGSVAVSTIAGNGTGTYNFSSGNLAAGPTVLSGTFAQTGGTSTFASLSVTGKVTLGGGALSTGSLLITGAGTVDITTNSLTVNYSGADPAALIRTYLISGYNALGTKWTGPGIVSSAAAANPTQFTVGYADGGNPADRANTGVPAGEIEIKYTVAGDANLSGSVDLSDLVIVASDFGQSGADWAEGDVNYDGNVDLSDLVIVASNFGSSLSSVSAAGFSSSFAAEWKLALAEVHGADAAVPEPGIISLALLSTAGLMARRRKTH